MEFKKYPHNPPHLFIDGAIYFITGGILDKQHILCEDAHKEFVLAAMEKWFPNFEWQLDAWIILNNHYHLVAKAKLAKDMPTIMARMHGGSATPLNRLDHTPGRQVWWNYWDTCIRGDRSHIFDGRCDRLLASTKPQFAERTRLTNKRGGRRHEDA